MGAGALALALTACGADPSQLTGRHTTDPGATDPGADPASSAPGPLCTEKPEGRSYTLFDGSHMEESRVNENVGLNRARLKPYAVMAGEYQRVLGLVPPSLAGAAGSFDDPPARWFSETEYSGVSMHALFDISFEAGGAATKTAPDFAAAPTDATAPAQCTTWMREAWSRSPSPEEIGACAELATKKLGDEPDARRRWTYVCASILSSAQFLTY
jgi:hypothetical protein